MLEVADRPKLTEVASVVEQLREIDSSIYLEVEARGPLQKWMHVFEVTHCASIDFVSPAGTLLPLRLWKFIRQAHGIGCRSIQLKGGSPPRRRWPAPTDAWTISAPGRAATPSFPHGDGDETARRSANSTPTHDPATVVDLARRRGARSRYVERGVDAVAEQDSTDLRRNGLEVAANVQFRVCSCRYLVAG